MPRRPASDRRAILVLEGPWNLYNGDTNRSTVLPYVEGIAKGYADVEVYHSRFYDLTSFRKALEALTSIRFENAVIYISAHGNGNAIGGARISKILEAVNECSRRCNITGVMLGSCFSGEDSYILTDLMENSSITWVAGYSTASYWLLGTLIDISIIDSMLNLEDQGFTSEQAITDALGKAVAGFSHRAFIGENRSEKETRLDRSLVFLAQPRGRGQRARSVTQAVLRNWADAQASADSDTSPFAPEEEY